VRQASEVRQRTEDYERASLSTWATLAVDTKGRERAEDPDPLRTAFQQDRDRILRCSAFGRLGDKTRSFLAVVDRRSTPRDRTLLAHALETAQLARTIARALRLNEDLVEAIALGHDLGHPPFGPVGEEALSAFADAPFRHHEQSVRVVEVLERDGTGLNLTWEVREGILHHPWTMPPPSTPEGQAARVANRIAVVTGDLGTALVTGAISAEEVPVAVLAALGRTPGQWTATFVHDVVATSLDSPEVTLSPALEQVHATLREFLAERVHARPAARSRGDRALHCLRSLVVYLLEHPDGLPATRRSHDPPVVTVLDEVSAMTDGRALAEFRRLFLPEDD
jgi:dGTPase